MRKFVVIAVLLVVALVAYCHWNDRLPAWAQCSYCTTAPVAPAPIVAPAKPAAAASKNCPPLESELDRDRVHRLAWMHEQIAKLLKAHRLTAAEAMVADRHVDARPDGDEVVGTDGRVRWSITLIGRTKPWAPTYQLVCTCVPHITGPVPPLLVIPKPRLPHLTFNPPPPVTECAEYDYDVVPGDEVRYAAFTRGRMSAGCWKLCDGDICSAPPSPCTPCDWLRPRSVIPSAYQPNYTGVYIAHHRHQRFFAPVGMMYEYFVLCIVREGHYGDSDSWIAAPSEWRGRSPYTTPLNHVYLVPVSQWPEWGKYDAEHPQ